MLSSDSRLQGYVEEGNLFVDNGSIDGTADHVAKNFPEVTLIRSPTNLGFIRANNLAYKQAKGKYVLMLNSDAFVCENTLQETVDFMRQHPRQVSSELGLWVGTECSSLRRDTFRPHSRFSSIGLDCSIRCPSWARWTI